jgi:branched-chain amino acid transport system substrate-binding protein
LTGESAKKLADGYTNASGRPWTQPIGFKHALFEVVRDVVSRSADLTDTAATVEAIKSTSVSTIVGDVNWANGPVPNVTKTPLVSGQWQKSGGNFDLVVTNNSHAPQIPLGGELKLLS